MEAPKSGQPVLQTKKTANGRIRTRAIVLAGHEAHLLSTREDDWVLTTMLYISELESNAGGEFYRILEAFNEIRQSNPITPPSVTARGRIPANEPNPAPPARLIPANEPILHSSPNHTRYNRVNTPRNRHRDRS